MLLDHPGNVARREYSIDSGHLSTGTCRQATIFPPARRERRDVAITLASTEVVLGTLSTLVGAILHAGAAFAYLAIFGVNISHLVLSLSSMTLAGAFIFGNSLRTVYESVVFLFVVRPYKVGDQARAPLLCRSPHRSSDPALCCATPWPRTSGPQSASPVPVVSKECASHKRAVRRQTLTQHEPRAVSKQG
jgi:hypothetical protein